MRFHVTLCALVALGEAASAQQPGAGQSIDSLRLTRRQAIAEALAHNPQIEVARQQTAQSRARRVEAIAVPDPALTAAYDASTRPFDFGSAGERNVAVDMLIPFPTKFWLRNKVARAEIGSFESNFRLQTQVIAAQTSQQYDSLLVARKHRDVLIEGRRLSADFLKRTQARYNAGTAAKLDVIKAQVGVAQAENDLIANERGVANARAALNRLLGRVLGAPIEAADSLTIPDAPPDLEQLEAIAMARRPELRALQSEQAGARASLKLAQQYLIPDIDFSITRSRPYGEQAEYETGIGIGLPIFFWQHQRGEVAEARSRTNELQAQYRDVAAQVGEDLRNAYATASTSLRQAIYLRDQLVPSAREAYRIASTSYSLGGSSALEVIDAQRTLLDAQTQYAAALAAANDAIADLERATGAPLSTVTRGGSDAR